MNTNIIDYLVTEKGFKQQDIAKRMGVSTAQVSKWKSLRQIARKREAELMNMADLWWDDEDRPGGNSSSFAIMVGSQQNQNAWIKYFKDLCRYSKNEIYSFEGDGVYQSFLDDTFNVFNAAGILIPTEAYVFVDDPKTKEAIELAADDTSTLQYLNFEDFLRSYWIAFQVLQVEFDNYAKEIGDETLHHFIRELAIYKLIIEDEVRFPSCDFIKLEKFKAAIGQRFEKLKEDINHQSEVYEFHRGMGFDTSFLDNLIQFPKPIGMYDAIPEGYYEHQEMPEWAIEQDTVLREGKKTKKIDPFNKIKSVSTTDLEDVIAKAISNELNTEYKVHISDIDYPSSFLTDAKISFSISRDLDSSDLEAK